MSQLNQLPMPTGPYQVGVASLDLVDDSRKSLQYPNGRLVPIWIYFPKEVTHESRFARKNR